MKIALLGDTAFFGKNSIKNNEQIFNYFSDIKKILNQYDYVIANLETPFGEGRKPYGYKSAYIYSEIQNVGLLSYLGISIVNLANNHLFDYGKKSYELTKQILAKNDIGYFGVEEKQIFIEHENNKIALSGYCCYSTNPLGLGKSGINELDYPTIEENLIKNSINGNNNILSIHAGTEHINFPSYDQIKFARKLSEIVPYVYYGHHPHVLQGIEKSNDSLIAYSLGNFCFDDVYTCKSNKPLVEQSTNNKSSIILELEYENNKLINNKAIPIFAGDEKMQIGIPDISKNLATYSLKLDLNERDYNNMRNELLTSIVKKRIAKRDLKWYLSRFNLRTFFVAKDLYTNKRKYNAKLKQYL
ncbi:MAG: CapA family protein [Melioribacteraceae bacterium]